MKTLAAHLPADNPLREFPYWDATDGRNLQAISALEWTETFLREMEKELSCVENQSALWHVGMALKSMRRRIELRQQQGVAGTNAPHIFVPERLDDCG